MRISVSLKSALSMNVLICSHIFWLKLSSLMERKCTGGEISRQFLETRPHFTGSLGNWSFRGLSPLYSRKHALFVGTVYSMISPPWANPAFLSSFSSERKPLTKENQPLFYVVIFTAAGSGFFMILSLDHWAYTSLESYCPMSWAGFSFAFPSH